MVVDYNKGKIYKLVNNTSDDIYIGSTCQSLAKRLGGHKLVHKRYLQGKSKNILTSFKLFDYDSKVTIVLIQEYPCSNKMELHKKEREYIESMKCLNKIIPCRTNKEYYEDNKDKIREYYENNKDNISVIKKKYREANKDKISEQRKEYREANKDKLSVKNKKYREDNKDKIKEYREDNKDKIKEYRENNRDKIKEYRENNRDDIREKRKQKVKCDLCNKEMRRDSIPRHKKTKHSN
jgi:hypothetical protein